jgi:hypothetical protein
VRARATVLIAVPEGIEVLSLRNTDGSWPRAERLASVVNDPYVHPTRGERLERLVYDVIGRADDVLHSRHHGRVIAMHLTPILAARLRALDEAQRRLEGWGRKKIAWKDRDEQEQLFLSIRPVGELWKRVGRKKVKIQPKQRRTLPVSVRFPPDLHAEVSAYADRLGADRTHVIVECVRQVLDGDREWKREWRKRVES